ncbi:MAG TPA: FecR domain-containing protein [Bryobacteraceae bacterium]|nr:FecR domain-containing protein [Bryobacteraceae bacterium]
MKNHWLIKSVALLGFIGVLCLPLGAVVNPPAPASAPPQGTARPGTINYVEGQASIDGRALSASQTGYVPLEPNQMLSTANGKVEILLSPGVFLRLGSSSAVRMVSPELSQPQIEVVRGEAMIEVDWMPKDQRIGVIERGAQASITKRGLYKFNSDSGTVAVIDGKIEVTENGQTKEFGKGKEIALTAAKLKPASFDRKAEDDLYRWSNVRSGYLAEASLDTAQRYYAGGYGPYWNAGWYWDPYFDFWSWMPYDGYFWSPFGYPFFSPGYVGYAPYFGYGRFGYGRFGYGRGFASRGFGARGTALAPRGFAGGGFHGGGFAGGGGFHGGAGGRR